MAEEYGAQPTATFPFAPSFRVSKSEVRVTVDCASMESETETAELVSCSLLAVLVRRNTHTKCVTCMVSYPS